MHLSGEKTLQQWENPPGSGPYYQTEFTPGSKLEMTRNPGFSRAPWPYIENLKIINITDAAGREAQFRGGETLAFTATNRILFEDILDDLGRGDRPKIYGIKIPSKASGPGFGMASQLRSPFNDIRTREAATRALDIDRLIEILAGGEALKTGPGITSFFTAWHVPQDDPQFLDWLRFDPQKSRQLIEAMRADGVDIDRELLYLFRQDNQVEGDQAVIAVQMFKEAGFNVRAESFPASELATRLARRATADFDFTATSGGSSEPHHMLRVMHTDSQYVAEAFCMCEPEYDAMVEEWEQTTDPELIASRSIAMQRWLFEHWATQFFWFLNPTRTLYKSTLRNINPFANVTGDWSWIDESYLEG